MEEYGNYNLNQNEGNQNEGTGAPRNFQPMPSPTPYRKPRRNNSKWAKKIGAIALSAVLFGGIAGGAFAGVAYASGAVGTNKANSTVSAATDAGNTETKTSALQTTSATSDGTSDSQSLDVSDIAAAAMPSIVAITNKSVQEVQTYFDMFGRSGGTQEQEVESEGSGIIIGQNDDELLIVTNNHVVENADTLSVCFIDDEAYEASVKGTDSDNDLAVIAVKLSDISEDSMAKIKVASIGDSASLKVGQQVVAIGNALGYGQSTTTGIISAVDRQVDDSESENGFIQTDAAINPGNSGGALLNMNGEVIGINSAKLASTEIEGMGYAIPTATASPIIEDLMNRTTRTKVSDDQAASIGISGQTVDSTIAQTYGIPEEIYIGEVNEGGAAQTAGLQAGSVITKFDGTSVTTMEDLRNLLTYYAAGETVTLTAKVANNGQYEEKEYTITLDKAQSTTTTSDTQSGTLNGESGAAAQDGTQSQQGGMLGSILR
ncbi:MAG: trypsin-like serine protease [Clostridia bacterium]|nr:trypsin-like serine protease [Clostridia bacterium]